MATPQEQESAMIERLAEKTGCPLEDWLVLVKGSGANAHGQIVNLLKSEHGVTHGYANLIAHKALRSDAGSSDDTDLVDTQYSGKKEAIRPIYDAVISKVMQFGTDVELAPKKAYVSLRRAKQFGLLQPAASRLDVGINLGDVPPTDRLELSGSFNAMVTHRVRVTSLAEVDTELIAWLRQAFDRA
jgi:predicted transport protein